MPLDLFPSQNDKFFGSGQNSAENRRVYTSMWHYNMSHSRNDSATLSLAIPSWAGTVSTSQNAVTPCCWGVKAGMDRVWVAGKTVWCPCYTRTISEHRSRGVSYNKSLYKSPGYTYSYWSSLRYLTCCSGSKRG